MKRYVNTLKNLGMSIGLFVTISCHKASSDVKQVHIVMEDKGHCLLVSHEDEKDISSLQSLAPYRSGACPDNLRYGDQSYGPLKVCEPFKDPVDASPYLYQLTIYEAKIDQNLGLVVLSDTSPELDCMEDESGPRSAEITAH